MESNISKFEVAARQRRAFSIEHQTAALGKIAMSLQEQSDLDRYQFMCQVRARASSEVRWLHKQVINNLEPPYQWLAQMDAGTVTQVIQDVIHFRQSWQQAHHTLPPTSRIYRHFRLQLETAEPGDEYLSQAVPILEALLKGDIKDGTLPF